MESTELMEPDLVIGLSDPASESLLFILCRASRPPILGLGLGLMRNGSSLLIWGDDPVILKVVRTVDDYITISFTTKYNVKFHETESTIHRQILNCSRD